jgi:fermentation-respiration switch protein FrsA (DUF1100 family)
MKTSCIAFAFVWLTLFAGSGCSDSGDRRSPTNADLRSAAEEFVASLAREDFGGAVGRFDATMKAALPESKLREAWRSVAEQSGPFKKTLGTRTMPQAGYEVVFVTCEFERAILDVKVVFKASGKITGLWFVPGQRPTADANVPAGPPATVREKEIKVGDGKWALPGTLTLPATGAGPWPAVVLVHGSGPNDRDETVCANKPFRDLAWGLAARGVAILRYEKATKIFPERFRTMRGLTVKEETIDDALNAVARLRATEGIATNRIFVLGHSLGGAVAPRIGQADPKIAGLIIMAGATRPLEDLVVEQTRYLLSLDGELSPDDQAKLAKLQADADKVKNLTDSSAATFVLGAPPSYWLDLRRYDAPATAKELKQPLLILQGGRDYQAAEADFEGWKQALASRPNVTFKLYPKLNHLFIAGEGKSTPAEYEQPGRVADEVVNDVADWISRR